MATSEKTSLLASFQNSYSTRHRRSFAHSFVDQDTELTEDEIAPAKARVCGSYRLFVTALAALSMIVCFSAQASMSSAMVCMLKDDTVSNSTNQTGDSTEDDNEWKFDWDKDTQAWVLASLYVGYYISQIPSSLASARFGPKRMIMISIVATSIAQGLTVPAAQLGLWWLYAARVITGFITGFLYAPIFSLLGFWAPRYEISLLLGCAGMGLELGNTVSFCVSMGACEVDFQGGWPLVFYILAAFGMVVAVLVGVFVSDSPLDNRFISQTEVDVIASAIPANFEKNNKAVAMIPVKKILTSMPVWAIVVSQLGSSMAYYMVINSLPMFFKDVIKVPALEVNLLSGLPFVAIIPTIYVIGMVSDRLVSGGYMSRTKCRKMNDFVNKIVVGCILVGMGFVPEGSTALAFVLNTAAAIALGFAYVSWLTNPTDLAPTFTGFIVGIGEMGSVWISIAIPLVVNHFTADKQRSSWQIVFIATACLQVCCFVFYLIFASGELQPWAVTTYKKDYGSVSLDKKNETVEVL